MRLRWLAALCVGLFFAFPLCGYATAASVYRVEPQSTVKELLEQHAKEVAEQENKEEAEREAAAKAKEAERKATEEREQREANERQAQKERQDAEEVKHAEEVARQEESGKQQRERAASKTCLVPSLKDDSLGSARKALSKGHCRLGKVTVSRRGDGRLVVVRQSIKSGSKRPEGTAVAVTLEAATRGHE